RHSLRRLVEIVFPNGTMLPDRVVTLVPFSETVNLGTISELYSWLDPKYGMDKVTGIGTDPDLTYFNSSRNLSLKFVGCFRREDASIIIDPDPVSVGSFAPFYPSMASEDMPLCPFQQSQVRYFENDPSELRNAIDNLVTAYSTGTDEGLLWGWRTLSPDWRSKFPASSKYPLDFSVSRKVLIL